MVDVTIQASIARLDQEILENKTLAKRVRREIAELVQETDEFQEIQRLEGELKAARTKLKIELQGDNQYNTLKSEQEELRFKGKDLKEILSHHLVEYRLTEHMSTVVTEPGVQKQIVLAGKLDKAEPENTRMELSFSGDRSREQMEADATLNAPLAVRDEAERLIKKHGSVERAIIVRAAEAAGMHEISPPPDVPKWPARNKAQKAKTA